MSKKRQHQLVILAGGSGTRLWPLSRRQQPKQLLRLAGGATLLQQALERADSVGTLPLLVITTADYAPLVRRQAPRLKSSQIIIEPCGRGTAVAIAVAAAITHAKHPGAVLTVLNSDQVIGNVAGFRSCIKTMARAAATGEFAFIGVPPTYPETGYGYIEVGPVVRGCTWRAMRSYREKPNAAAAARYIASKKFFWNPGIFSATTDQWLAKLRQYAAPAAAAADSVVNAWGTRRFGAALTIAYRKLRGAASIDYAVMEHLRGGAVVPAKFTWTDVGHWRSVHDVLSTKPGQTVAVGKHLDAGSRNVLVYSGTKRLIATVGLADLAIVDTPDALLVCSRDQAQAVREIVAALEQGKYRRFR